MNVASQDTPGRSRESAAVLFHLVEQVTGQPPRVHDVSGETVRIGRAEENDIRLLAPFVSRHLAEVRRQPEGTRAGYRLHPEPGATPLVYRGQLVTGPMDLAPGDFFRVTGPNAGEMLTLVYAVAEQAADPSQGIVALDVHTTVRIGSAPGNDLGVGSAVIDPRHAEIRFVGDRFQLAVLGKGLTQVNNATVEGTVALRPGDSVRIGSLRLRWSERGLEYHDTAGQWLIGQRRTRALPEDLLNRMEGVGGVLMEALHLHKRVRSGVDLLRDISLRIRPRELVILVGLSGAGKTSLLNALAGYQPATDGQVLVDHADLYRHFDRFRTGIGFVPQRDIIHRDLTIYEALDYAARLRLPPGTAAEARHRRIEEVLADLDLTERRHVRVRSLSGGQQKRVSIGVELITSPQLFFLDEPTSGLDPGTETGVMQLLRRLADQGRTVILVTHATKNVMLADKVLFMVRGGHVAWYGPPVEALAYFNLQRPERERDNGELEFDAIYSLLDDASRGTAEEWAERYQRDPAYQKYIAAPLHLTVSAGADQRPREPVTSPAAASSGAPAMGAPPEPARQISALQQFFILSARNLKLLTRDRIALALMLLAAPILASLDFLIMSRHMYDPVQGDPLRTIIGASILATNGVFVGALSQTREIIKDTDIYRRERLVNLKVTPYVLSKVWLAVLLALYQALAWVGVLYLAVQMPGGLQVALGIYVTVVLTVLAGMMLGLFASAVAPTEESVTLIVALLIIPQVLFNGAFMPLPKLGPAGRAVTVVMASRWSFEAIMTQSEAGKDLGKDPGWRLPTAQRLALTDAQKLQDKCLGIHIFTECTFPGIRSFYQPSVNAPPPQKPRAPPTGSRPAAQAQYQTQLLRYQRTYAAWQVGLTGPISAAEAVLADEYDKYGGSYNVNVLSRWLILAGMTVALIVIILGVQKAKDQV